MAVIPFECGCASCTRKYHSATFCLVIIQLDVRAIGQASFFCMLDDSLEFLNCLVTEQLQGRLLGDVKPVLPVVEQSSQPLGKLFGFGDASLTPFDKISEVAFVECIHLVQFRSVRFSSAQFSSVQFSSVQFSTVQCNGAQFSSVQHSTVQ